MNGIPILVVLAVTIVCAIVAVLLPDEDDDEPGSDTRISAATRRAIIRHELTRGVDLPRWRTPKEIADMQQTIEDRS